MGFVFPTVKMVSFLLFGILALNCLIGFGSNAQLLPEAEFQTLQTIFSKLQHNSVTVSRTSCTDGGWNYVILNSDTIDILSNITCDCSDGNNTICHVTNMHLRGLNLTGSLPSEFENLTHLTELDLTRNYLNGSIPSSFSKLPLVILSLLGNRLSGSIPPEIGDIATLRGLLLNANNFTGTIPESFGKLKNSTDFRIDGIDCQGRYPISLVIGPNLKDYFEVDTGPLASAVAGVVVSSCVIVLLLLVVLQMKGYFGSKDPEDNELHGLNLQTGYFTLKQIKAATDNFNPVNKIGEGGFGPVYKGVMSDGVVIAVKQLTSKSKQGNRKFLNEIVMISALQHPNLVNLYGCCTEGNQLLLVYEYMENNSLARALFGCEENRLKLDWPTRTKICLGIARGLTYLHEESRLKIVHRDIKATNVLLDRALNAQISDFGLAKLNEEKHTHISTWIAGTIGYMAPEYVMRGYLTDKADVYSFGVVALEILSGKSNTSYMPKENFVYLLDWEFYTHLLPHAYLLQEHGNHLELVDPNLRSDYSTEEALRLLNLALLCTNPSPTLRPFMSSVVSMIEGKTAVQAPTVMRSNMSPDSQAEFKALERLSQDSQAPRSMSIEGPYIDSSVSLPDDILHQSSSRKLLQ
ncbi:hypothetical protein SLA2020_244140 [Shorea laevis]